MGWSLWISNLGTSSRLYTMIDWSCSQQRQRKEHYEVVPHTCSSTYKTWVFNMNQQQRRPAWWDSDFLEQKRRSRDLLSFPNTYVATIAILLLLFALWFLPWRPLLFNSKDIRQTIRPLQSCVSDFQNTMILKLSGLNTPYVIITSSLYRSNPNISFAS